jgi:hypothetical protein
VYCFNDSSNVIPLSFSSCVACYVPFEALALVVDVFLRKTSAVQARVSDILTLSFRS